ncbi:MAG: YciI family protein [Rhodobacteraceae bacterium]|nr:YciI family protein [Paracoccaceae bacterium]
MQYMALIYSVPGAGPAPGTPEFGEFMQGYMSATETFKKDGVFVAGDALKGGETATSVRKRGGKVETMDGPFAETKEQLGGYYIFDCEDLDAALRYAAMIPTSQFGTIEVRPVMMPEDYGS